MARKGWTKIEVPEGWTQIILGSRPPWAKWQQQRGKRIPSAASKNGNDVKSPLEKPAVPRKESVPPDVAAAAARKRVEKLEAVLVTLGENDDIFPVIREAFTKARAQAQVRLVSERIQACKSFLEKERKRVEFARQTTVKARGSLAEAVAAQEKQEALLADGEQRLSQLFLEKKNNVFLFNVNLLQWTLLPSWVACRVSSTIYKRSWPGCGQFSQWIPRSHTTSQWLWSPLHNQPPC